MRMCFLVRFLMTLALAAPFCLAAAAGWQEVAGPLPDDPLGVRRFRLDNGLEVYLSENHDTPRFYAEMAVRAGSKDDPDDSTGLAHYMEHLLFKGSERLGTMDFAAEKPLLDKIEALYEEHFTERDPARRAALYRQINDLSVEAAKFAAPNELDRLYRALGGRALNAHTWHEEVVYKIDLPSNMLRQWAAIEADRFARPVFRLFQTELETVYEEMNRALDNKSRVIQLAVNAALFKEHPYGQKPTLGTVEDLKNPSLRNLHRFYETWYVPNNMAIFISGDIDSGEAMAVIDEYFSSLEPRDLPERRAWDDPAPQAREEVRVPYQAEEFVLLAFRTAPRGHPDAEALMMVDMLLDNASAGLININLNQRQAVLQAGAFPMPMNDHGAQYLYGIPKPGQTMEQVERLLLDQLDLIKRGEFGDWLIPAIINDYRRNEKTGLESDESRVSAMRSAWIAFEPWERAAALIERMGKVTREDVIRVANQYFSGGYVAGFREDAPKPSPRVEKPELAVIEIDGTRLSPFAAEIMAMPARPMEPRYILEGRDYARREDARGVTYYHVQNPMNDVFSFSIAVDRGGNADPLSGIAARLMQLSGTKSLAAEALQQEWYKLGTTFSVGADDHETFFSLTGLDANFEASVALLMDLAWNPAVEPDALEQLKANLLRQREDSRKDMATMADALVQFHRYGEESPFRRMPPAERVRALTAEELQGVIRAAMASRQSVSYTGTLAMGQVMDTVRRLHPVKGLLDDTPPLTHRRLRAPEAPQVWMLQREAAQAHIQIEFGGGLYDPARSPEVQLYNSYFADGMAGIVFQELREARALAYMAGARYNVGRTRRDQDIMLGVIQTQADKTTDALAAFLDLLDNMPREQARFDAAKEGLVTSYRTGKIGFRGVIGTVRGWERRELFSDPRPGWYQAILDRGSLEMVSGFQQEAIASRPKLISIVGDRARIPMDALKQFGEIRELTLDDVFVE